MHQHYQKRKPWKSEYHKWRIHWPLWLKNSHNPALVTVPRVHELYPQPPVHRQRGIPKETLTNPINNCRDDWGHQLREVKREWCIMIMFQNMVGMDNTLDQFSQHKLDTLKKNMINEWIAIIGFVEANSNWINISIKDRIYNRTDGRMV